MRIDAREAVELVAVRVVPGRAEGGPAVGGAHDDTRDDAGDVAAERTQPPEDDVQGDEPDDGRRLILDEIGRPAGEAGQSGPPRPREHEGAEPERSRHDMVEPGRGERAHQRSEAERDECRCAGPRRESFRDPPDEEHAQHEGDTARQHAHAPEVRVGLEVPLRPVG